MEGQNTVNIPPAPKHSFKNIIILLFFAFIIVVISSITTYYYLSSKSTVTIDETKDWKTYINNKNEYIIKYPNNFNIELSKEYGESYIFLRNINNRQNGLSIVWVLKRDKNQPIEDFANNYFIGEPNKFQFEKKEVDSRPARLLKLIQGSGSKKYTKYYIFIEKDSSHIIYISSFPVYQKNDSNEIIFNQILSTFKFTK